MRESVPRQVDRESRGPQGERDLEFSRRKKGQTFFHLPSLKVKSESEVRQSCPTLSDPLDCSLPGSSIHGIFQARVLEWGAIAFSISTWRSHLLKWEARRGLGEKMKGLNIDKV